MQKTDVLIIGGSAGGLTTAISARRNYPDKGITLIRKEKQVLIPCAIPYLCETIGSTEKNLISDEILSKNNIELIVGEVRSLDRKNKVVNTIKEQKIRYEKLVLATGSLPVIPPIVGVSLKNVFVVKKDVRYLQQMLKVLEKAKNIVIIGGGFIGLEFADELSKKDKNITIVEMLPHCLQLAYDEEFCLKAEEELEKKGVKILTNNIAEKIEGENRVEYIKLKKGEKLKADVVILGIGVVPNVKIAEDAELKIGQTKGIWVDEYQRTSDQNIFAVGDCAEKTSFFTKAPFGLKLASIAAREARIAGASLFNLKYRNEGTIGTFATVIGGVGFGVSGFTERKAREEKIDFVKQEASTVDKHPSAMTASSKIFVKLLFRKSSKEIIGGQVLGGPTTGEVTNIIAAMIQNKMKAEEIIKFQLGTHPALTPSPVVWPIMEAAEKAMGQF